MRFPAIGEYSEGKQGETWLPIDLERLIYCYADDNDIDDDEPLINKSKKTLQNWVDNAAEHDDDDLLDNRS